MSYIRVPKLLAIETQPLFIGWLDHWQYNDNAVSMDIEPLTQADVFEILFSLYARKKMVTGFNSADMVFVPVEGYQDIPIGVNCIKTPFRWENEVFAKMQIEPMQANFIFVPENIPPLFADAGTYVARFDFLDNEGKKHPQAVEMTVG
jgi:hypothetical protein